MIKVYLNSNFIIDSINQNLTGELTHVANIDILDLEKAFYLTQNLTDSWIKNKEIVPVINELQRSISAGDVFEYADTFYFIDMIRFKEIEVDKSKIK